MPRFFLLSSFHLSEQNPLAVVIAAVTSSREDAEVLLVELRLALLRPLLLLRLIELLGRSVRLLRGLWVGHQERYRNESGEEKGCEEEQR